MPELSFWYVGSRGSDTGSSKISTKRGNKVMNELLKLIHKAEERARTDDALERKRAFSLFFLVSKSPF